MAYDIVIKDGSVFNGKGSKPEKIDIGIKGDKIDKLGSLNLKAGKKTIDAKGKFVCPGFIDLTTHSDNHWTLLSQPIQKSLLSQGVTTMLGGNCGFSLAPVIFARDLKKSQTKYNINWRTMGEFLSHLSNNDLSLNFATLVGLSAIQDENHQEESKFLLEGALSEGAFGLSTNLGFARSGYWPDEKLSELFGIVTKHNGITKHHLEDEGQNILPSISRLINLARESNSKLHISHFKVLGRGAWRFSYGAREMMRNARSSGLPLTTDFFPYEKTGSNLFMFLPAWLRKMDKEEILEILGSPKNVQHQSVIEYLKSITLHYDRITIASSLKNSENVGKTIARISALTELSPEEIIISLLFMNSLDVSVFNEVISETDVKEILKEEYSIVASDGVGYDTTDLSSNSNELPHPRSFGTFPRVFRKFVREDDIITWEEAIHKMTGLPAAILGLKDRGIIAKDAKADIVIFNPETISDYSTYEDPFQFSRGIDSVIINGSVSFENGTETNNFSGRILKKK